MNELEKQIQATRNYHAMNAKKNSRLLEKLKLNAALKANAILRSAMYDIIELESGTLPATAVQVFAEKALTESALDENGRMAEPANCD